jgi:flagellin-like protein
MLNVNNKEKEFKMEKHKNKMNKKKKGLSPVIANILLVAFVIAMIALIFLWFRGMVEEGIVKFDKNIRLVCDDINFDISYSQNVLTIQNNGLPPIYTFNVKIMRTGEFETIDISELGEEDTWQSTSGGLRQAGIYSQTLTFEEGINEIAFVPVLVGTDSKNKYRKFTCEGQYEKKIAV